MKMKINHINNTVSIQTIHFTFGVIIFLIINWRFFWRISFVSSR